MQGRHHLQQARAEGRLPVALGLREGGIEARQQVGEVLGGGAGLRADLLVGAAEQGAEMGPHGLRQAVPEVPAEILCEVVRMILREVSREIRHGVEKGWAFGVGHSGPVVGERAGGPVAPVVARPGPPCRNMG